MKQAPSRLVMVVGLALSGSLWLAGCGEEPSSVRGVREAGNTMVSVAGGADAAVAIEDQEKAFSEAMGELSSAQTSGDGPFVGLGAQLGASVKLGQVGPAAAKLGEIADKTSEAGRSIATALSRYRTLRSLAEASQFDPSPRTNELNKEVENARSKIAEATATLQSLEARQAKTLADAKARDDEAAGFERQAVGLKEQARPKPAAEASPILEQALVAQAKADERRLEAAKLRADALLLEPEKLGASQRIEELTKQIATLENEKKMVAARAETAGKARSETEAEATKVAGELDAMGAALRDMYQKELTPALEALVAAGEAGVSAGSKVTGAGGSIVKARAKHRMADIELTRLRQIEAYGTVMGELARVTPALSGSAGFAEQAKAAADAAKESREKVKLSYTEASEAYGSVATKTEAAEAAKNSLVSRLKAMAEPKDDKTAIRDLYEAAKAAAAEKDLAKLGELSHATGPAKEALDSMVSMGAAIKKLDEACKSKFGKTATEAIPQLAMMSGAGGLGGMAEVNVDALDVKIQGDKATVTIPGKDKPDQLVKVDGRWLFSADAEMAEQGAGASAMMAMIKPLVGAIEGLASQVEDGTIDSIDGLGPALQKAMMEAMGAGGGAPGADVEN